MIPHLVAPRLTPYAPRQIRFLRLHREMGATLKVYGLGLPDCLPDASMVDAGVRMAMASLVAGPAELVAAGVDWSLLPTYGLGTVMVHLGREALFVLLDYWVGENMLRHQVWVAPLHAPTALESMAGSDIAMCVWEVAVLQHERAAWLRHGYTTHGGVDVAAFLADVLNADL
jgi:hypothetical protein